MNTASIRWRLPISYAGIALLSAFVLGSVLVLTLQSFYTRQEQGYLMNSVQLMGPDIARFLEENPDSSSLDLYIENLAFLIQARIKLLDNHNQIIADSGSLQSQRFIYTNLTPNGMSAEVLQEGKADRYFFHIGINIISDTLDTIDNSPNLVSLPQLPTENTLCGFGLGYEDTKSLLHTDQSVSYPLTTSNGQQLGELIISEGLAFGGKIIDSVIRSLVYASLVAVLVAASVGWWIGRKMVAPLTELTETTQHMTSGELSARVKVNTKDEFGILARSFNTMADRIEDLVATLRSFIADAAHELHTPITTLRVNLDLAADDPSNLDEYIPPAQTQVNRMQTIVDNMLDLSRIEAGKSQQTRFSLSSLIRDCAGKYTSLTDQARISFKWQIPENEIQILGDSAQIRQCVDNILDNALKFTPTQGSIQLKLKADSERAIITVQDTGIGIPEDDIPKLFQRFHRGRNTVEYPGSGLGLAIVKAIVDQHLGVVEVESNDTGTTIRIILPLSS